MSVEHIAIIGLSCRLPRAANVEEFWANLRDGVDCLSWFSDEELRAAGARPEALRRPDVVKSRGALDRIEWFDAAFFAMTPEEAEITDPQHRIFLECAWEALEDAGYDSERFDGRIGVFGGMSMSSYLKNVLLNSRTAASTSRTQIAIAHDKDHLCTRVSYKLNLRGPSMTVQTASSTSLVAVSVACQSLLDHECDIALAGAVSISATQRAAYFAGESDMASPDGRCRAFDAAANGTVDGSGAGIVVLRRLSDSRAAGDRVRAVIRGWAVNNDGSGKVGYTAPSVLGQEDVISEALAMADVDAGTIGFVEAHGSGTPLGDSIEAEALIRAFGGSSARPASCGLGSVKTNIGHLAVASGIAGLLKTVLAIERGCIPATLHFERPNPNIPFASSPFYVNNRLRPWTCDGPRRAGVNSQGFGGTNVHVVLEQAPAVAPRSDEQPIHLLVLSARTPSALRAASCSLACHLRLARPSLGDVSYTLAVGRRQFPERRAIVTTSVEGAIASLESDAGMRRTDRRASAVFVFPGAGMHRVRMPSALARIDPALQQDVAECVETFARHRVELGAVLRDGPDAGSSATDALPPATERAAQFSVSYALARAWMRRGVRPRAVLGRGVGEVAAAVVAGVVTLEDAIRVVAASSGDSSSAAIVAALQSVVFRAPQVPIVSSVTGRWMSHEATDREYWARQPFASIQFFDAMRAVTHDNDPLVIEMGSSGLDREMRETTAGTLSSMAPSAGADDDLTAFLEALGSVWMRGGHVDWERHFAHATPCRIPLPTYPFERQRYWVEPTVDFSAVHDTPPHESTIDGDGA